MAILSVFISVFSIAAVALISDAGKTEIQKELDGVGLNGMSVSAYNSSDENITDENLYNLLSENDCVDTLTPVLYDYAQVEFSTGVTLNCMCWGISPTAEKIVNLRRIHGRMLTDNDIDNQNMVCLLDEAIAERIYGRSNITGKQLYLTAGSGIYKLKVVGIVSKTSNVLNGLSGDIIPDFIYIPFTTMEKIFMRQNLDQILINVKDKNISEADIEKTITTNKQYPSSVSLKITNLSRQRESINRIVDAAFLALFAVSCVAVIVCSISVATSVNTAVNVARHDIGIKISLGARKTDIMLEFLLCSLCACITGIMCGLAAGFILLVIVNTLFQSTYTFDSSLILGGISVTIFLSVLFSIYPSYRAAGLLPVKALNRE